MIDYFLVVKEEMFINHFSFSFKMPSQIKVEIYETPLFSLAREVAQRWTVRFGLSPGPFYSSPLSADNLILKQEEWARDYDDQNKHVGNRLVRYFRHPSSELLVKIKQFALHRDIDAVVESILPELYADRPRGEFAFFEKKHFAAPEQDRGALIRTDDDRIEIIVRGKDSGLVMPQLEKMANLDINNRRIELRPHAAFDAIKSYLLR